jgi:SAM-dependent methyltransferase
MLTCRLCTAPLGRTFVDLGMSPLANSYIAPEDAEHPERFYPLHARVCDACLLVQLPAMETPEAIFSDYAYFSSVSATWLDHARRYAEEAIERWQLGAASRVVEIASNDGYLLRNFVSAGVPALGVEPAANVAATAIAAGVPTLVDFFGAACAERIAATGHANLIVANNVLAHVPDMNDFLAGFAALLAPRGVATFEFPHLLNLIEQTQFDTIYHEHYSYLSLGACERALARHGLAVFDVEEVPTHGGSLRVFAAHDAEDRRATERAEHVRAREREAGMDAIDGYRGFAARVADCRDAFLTALIDARRDGLRVAAYGAPAKGNTLLNYCGVRSDLIAFTVDRSPHKQGLLLPGTRIPILSPDAIATERPDILVVLPWNLRDEIIAQMAGIRAWGGRFLIPVPRPEIIA